MPTDYTRSHSTPSGSYWTQNDKVIIPIGIKFYLVWKSS